MSVPRSLEKIGCLLAMATLTGCQQMEDADVADAGAMSVTDAGVVDVTAKDFEFEAPARIPSGWVTFRFTNEGDEEHLFILWHLPEGRTFREYRTEVADSFFRIWNRYASGELDREETLEALGSGLPEWFSAAEPGSGPALTESGETSRTTVRLEPGTYAMECYVKTPQGTWHSERGMLRELTVTSETSGVSPPTADAELTLSNYEIGTSGELSAGTRTVAVHVKENPDGAGLRRHDINLFRLDGAEVAEIVAWMDPMHLAEYRAPAPGRSLGGVEPMPAGNTGYVTVDLEPGRYAWVSESYGARGMVEEFTID